jgi:hypothetical protein
MIMSPQKKSIIYMLFALSLALTLSCNLTSALYGDGEEDQVEQPVATLPPEPEPTEPAAPLQQALTQFAYNGVELEYDPAFVTYVNGKIEEGFPCDVLSPTPPHITLNIDLAIDAQAPFTPTLSVFPVQDYINLCGETESVVGSSSVWVNETLDALKGAIATQSGDVRVPPLPLVNAGEPLHERGQYLPFRNGAGVRAIVAYAHDVWFFHNDSIMYYFQGLTADGEYYVTASFPVDAPFLIDSPEPSENTNEQAIPIPEYNLADFQSFSQVVETYNTEARRLFGLTTDAEFIPDISALDAFIASLLVAPDPAAFSIAPSSGPCTLIAEQDVTIYRRPYPEAEVFSTLSAGLEVTVGGVTADGWYGFDPAVAQAANIGVFRLRWVDGSIGVRLEGGCGGVPEMVGPLPGICFTMPMGDVPVYVNADMSSAVVATLVMNDYAAVLGRTDDGWAQVDLSAGNTGLELTGWIEAATLNMNGPCWDLPTLTP